MVDLEAAVELLSAGRQQVDVCTNTNDTSTNVCNCIRYVADHFIGTDAAFKRALLEAAQDLAPTLISPTPSKTKGFQK